MPLKKGLRRKQSAPNRVHTLHLEELEDRRLLATFIVNTTQDWMRMEIP